MWFTSIDSTESQLLLTAIKVIQFFFAQLQMCIWTEFYHHFLYIVVAAVVVHDFFCVVIVGEKKTTT